MQSPPAQVTDVLACLNRAHQVATKANYTGTRCGGKHLAQSQSTRPVKLQELCLVKASIPIAVELAHPIAHLTCSAELLASRWVCFRYKILWTIASYHEYGTTMLVVLEAPTVGSLSLSQPCCLLPLSREHAWCKLRPQAFSKWIVPADFQVCFNL